MPEAAFKGRLLKYTAWGGPTRDGRWPTAHP